MPGTELRHGNGGTARVFERRIHVLPITADEHARFAQTHSASILQTPAWAEVKPAWQGESLGWFESGDLIGTALVLYRPVPHSRRSLAYVPEGPTLPWRQVIKNPEAWLEPLLAHLRHRRAFAVRIGPTQRVRAWSAATAKSGMAVRQLRRFGDLEPDQIYPDGTALLDLLHRQGWLTVEDDSGRFTSGQPRLGVRLDLRGKTPDLLLAGMSQQWRRNIRRSQASGVIVRTGGETDLALFQHLYVETAERDGFTPRSASYFQTMWHALNAGPDAGAHPALRLWIGELDGEPLAAALTVDAGPTRWYTYGGSTTRLREAQASTAVQWAAMQAALERDLDTYDLRGIADTLDEDERLAGLLRFKLGTGGEVVETTGEWERTLSPLWHRAFKAYLKARS